MCFVCLFGWLVFFAVSHGLQDLSSHTRDQTWGPTVKVLGPNHWTASEFPKGLLCFRNILYHWSYWQTSK